MRPMRGEVTRNRNVQSGQPVLAGTRMSTESIWNYWEQGYDEEGIQEEYPHLTIKQIVSAVLYEEQWWRRIERRLDRWRISVKDRICGCD